MNLEFPFTGSPRYVPLITEGWIGRVRQRLLRGEIGEARDEDLLADLTRSEREAVKTLCGCGPKTLLRRWRVEYGLWVLRDRDLTVGRAAAAAGFHDASHFIRATQETLGFSPAEFLEMIGRG